MIKKIGHRSHIFGKRRKYNAKTESIDDRSLERVRKKYVGK